MAIDLERLSPAPWKCCMGAGGGGGYFPYLPERRDEAVAIADGEFIALARNAYDVMMRRKWSPGWSQILKGWVVTDHLGGYLMGDGNCRVVNACPFKAVLAADRWFKEHVDDQNT